MNAIRRHILQALVMDQETSNPSAVLRIDPAFPLLEDHFKGNPVMPGICLIQAVLLTVAQARGDQNLRMTVMKDCKFFSAALPGDEVMIIATVGHEEDGALPISADLSVGERRVARIILLAEPVSEKKAEP